MLTSGAQNYSKMNAVNIFLKFNLASLRSIVDIIKKKDFLDDYHKGLWKKDIHLLIIIRDYQKKLL